MDETDHLLSPVRPRRKRSWTATILSTYFCFLYASVLIITLISLGSFTVTVNKVRSNDTNEDTGHEKCILFGKNDNEDLKLGNDSPCNVTIYGEAVLALLSLLLVTVSICRALWGKWLSCLLVFNFTLLVLSVVIAFSLGVIISIGFHMTCSAQNKISHDSSTSCYDLQLPGTDIKYGANLHISEITIWMSFGAFAFCFLLELIFSMCSCVCGTRRRNPSYYNDWIDEKSLS